MRTLVTCILSLLIALATPLPAQAAVTITFWSHEFGNDFPHTFFTLRGRLDAGGPPIDANYGFTAKSVTPALLFKTVAGRLDISKRGYLQGSDARFSVAMTDAQYASIMALTAAWDEKTGDSRYNLNHRNCVHFIAEAVRRLGLAGADQPLLMKRPRSYLMAVEAANVGRVILVNTHGKQYLATLPPVPAEPQPAIAKPRDATGSTAEPIPASAHP